MLIGILSALFGFSFFDLQKIRKVSSSNSYSALESWKPWKSQSFAKWTHQQPRTRCEPRLLFSSCRSLSDGRRRERALQLFRSDIDSSSTSSITIALEKRIMSSEVHLTPCCSRAEPSHASSPVGRNKTFPSSLQVSNAKCRSSSSSTSNLGSTNVAPCNLAQITQNVAG